MVKEKNIIKFSDVFLKDRNLEQEDFDFVDIKLNKDTELFLNPSLIEGNAEIKSNLQEWMIKSNKIIDSFFRTLFEAYRNNEISLIKKLLGCAHEPNETNLGLSSKRPNGKGNTEKGLINIFKDMKNLLEKGLIENNMDTCVFIKEFAEDGMSDLITNILRKQLYEFTVSECSNYGIDLSDDKYEIGHYWNEMQCEWELLVGPVLKCSEKRGFILLVPKTIVSHSYKYSIGEYLSKKILEDIQERELQKGSNLCRERILKNGRKKLYKPSKKLVIKEILMGEKHKQYAIDYTIKNKSLIEEFRDEMRKANKKGKNIMSDKNIIKYIEK